MDERQRASLERYIEASVDWVKERRDFYRREAQPLGDTQRNLFEPFFSREILEHARFASIGHMLEGPQETGLPKFSLDRVIAFTLIDTVVETPLMPHSEEQAQTVRFHELVHVVQTRILGVDQTIRRYLSSWADEGFTYLGIPFEMQAYMLQMDFEDNPNLAFSVEERVIKSLRAF